MKLESQIESAEVSKFLDNQDKKSPVIDVKKESSSDQNEPIIVAQRLDQDAEH